MSPSEIPFHKFLNENKIEFEIQKVFDDLFSSKNQVLRFDFYLPGLNILVEIDGPEHLSNKRSIDSDKLKEAYCMKNKIKLFRFTSSTAESEFNKIFGEYADMIIRIGPNTQMIS